MNWTGKLKRWLYGITGSFIYLIYFIQTMILIFLKKKKRILIPQNPLLFESPGTGFTSSNPGIFMYEQPFWCLEI